MQRLPHFFYTEYLEKISSEDIIIEHFFDTERCLKEFPLLNAFLNRGSCLSFILDYRTGNYYHFSANAKQIIGYDREAFLSHGVGLALDIYHHEDAKVYYNAIFAKRLSFMRHIPPEQCADYSYQHTFRLLCRDKKFITILQEYTVLKTDAKGNPLIILGFCTDITAIKDDYRIVDVIKEKRPGEYPRTLEVNYYYPYPGQGILSVRELEILKWIIEGLTSEEIAEKLHLSLHTVYTHRKNIREKTNAKNVAELLHYAKQNKLT